MKTLALNRVVWLALVTMAVVGQAVADPVVPHEPNAQEGYYRELRSDYVRTWHIFKDTTGEGILNPGDTSIEQFNNWWTPVSSGSQGLYDDHPSATGSDLNSGAQNWATYNLPDDDPNKNDPNFNYWLPRQENTMSFYMSYSQFDNCDWQDPAFHPGDNAVQQQMLRERHAGRNGWVLGWVINDIDPNASGTPAGTVNMDVAVHNGQLDTTVAGWGESISNPQVSMSNDIDAILSVDHTLSYVTRHPPTFDETTDSYTWAANEFRMTQNGLNAADLATLVASMELKETGGFDTGLVDHGGDAYLYEDGFEGRFSYLDSTDDGGVLAGLSGYDGLNPNWSNWGDQQVIRIEIDAATLAASGITELRFFDFGDSVPGSSTSDQVNPRDIVFGVDVAGNVYFDDPVDGRIYFTDNRIFIAVSNIPEPASLIVLAAGGTMVLLRRRRTV